MMTACDDYIIIIDYGDDDDKKRNVYARASEDANPMQSGKWP